MFGVLIYPGVEELDFQGPWELVGMWHRYAGGPKPLLIAQSDAPVTCAHGMRVLPDETFSTCGALSYLLVPGGFAAFDEMNNPVLTNFVKQQSEHVNAILSVCSGSFILLAAGLLQGRKAATNWKVLSRLRQAGVEVVEDRFVRDGKVWSSAGVSAGMDATLALIAQEAGEEVASTVQLNAEYYPSSKTYGSAHRLPEGAAYFRSL
ncbi:DJ-1/PfpI family protein [Rhodoferax sp.]|uniref:DJ-1/PfpI family protein n=1 Tax=Rhodoferax sp. TaxID=50421 RepID=UPI00260EDE5E|nr:DJ-1/PfpI family protein [Rhodoferax sp.]MDD2926212.1 DJ-1/PfpI family protein [Rhodoferax sp.]